MSNIFVIISLTLALTFTQSLADVSSFQDQNSNQEHLDPLNDQDQDLTTNNQDKRTLCGALNKCLGGSSAGHVRHVIVKPAIRPQLVGYAPVVRPIGIRPIVIGGYKYSKPKVHFRLQSPNSLKPVFGGWNPVVSSGKPAIQVIKPAGHHDVVHTRPIPHVDHVHAPAVVHVDHEHHNVAAPGHTDHVHVQPGHVHVRPVAVQGAHVDQVHQINVPHGSHYDTFTHVDHIHQAVVPVAQPVVPVAPPPTIVKPFVPSPVLFEVTRPNLGVLPLGARFPSPILREVSHYHFKPVVPIAPAVPVAPVIPVASPVPVAPAHPVHHQHYHPTGVVPHHPVQGIVQTPVGFPHISPQPGVSVEYHGTRNYLPLSGAVPFLHQTPVNAAHPLPTGFGISTAYPHQHLPFEHAHHDFIQSQQLPHDHQAQGFFSQQLPHDHQVQSFFSQQLPHDHQAQFSPEHQLPPEPSPHFLQNQVQAAQQYQEIPQGQLPLEGEPNFEQFLQGNSVNVQNFNQNNVIQPGQTDVQIPYHLPQHPWWEATSGFQQQQQIGLQEESRGFGDQVFRPSPQLEPPYKK